MRYSGSPYALCSLVLFFILAVSGLVKGSSVNHTIDDFLGDSVTGELVQYLPQVPAGQEQLWINQKSCATCADVPDATLAFDKTWSAARYLASVGSLSVNMKFKGTAIYVFFIIPNFAANSGLASAVLCDFFIDGAAVGSFNHQSDGSGGFVYDTLVYKNTNVPDGDHVLLIETTGADPALIIFDYAIYTEFIPDSSSPAPPPPSPTPPAQSTLTPPSSNEGHVKIPESTTGIANTGSAASTATPTTEASSPSDSDTGTQTDTALAFPTAPDTVVPSSASSSGVPFLLTRSLSDANSPFSTTTPSLSPDPQSEAARRATPVIAIVGAVAGAIILVVLGVIFFVLCRRRRRLRAETGTISVFDLLDDGSRPRNQRLPPPGQPHRTSTSQNASSRRPHPQPRPLPAPPMSEHRSGGRSIDATPTKTNMHTPGQSPFAEVTPSASGHHSTQSSVSHYSDSRSDLHIHIPMTSFRPPYSQTHSPSPSFSHSHSHSNVHGHSPITRNGVPIPPEQADIVRDIVLSSLAPERDRTSIEGSIYTPSTDETGPDQDDMWAAPIVHVDSGIRISRALMELPPQYAAA